MTRVAAVIIKDGRVALIERRRGADLDYVFPGCEVSIDDPADTALASEVRNSLGLDVTPGRLIADIASQDEARLFFLAQVEGSFDSANGSARGDAQSAAEGERPVWLPIFGLTALPVHPKAVALLVEFSGNGWPHEVLTLTDRGRPAQTARVHAAA